MASSIDASQVEGPAPKSAVGSPPSRLRVSLLALLVAVLALGNGYRIAVNHAPGCARYSRVSHTTLIAHAGGGLPGRMYPNSIEALDNSYAHGLRIFEMDFRELPFGILRAGHDPLDVFDPREAWLPQVVAWLRRHPDTRLLVDMKTDNVSGLRLISAASDGIHDRIIPYVYSKHQYAAVRSLGFSLPIYALFDHEDSDWLEFANSHAFAAVALSSDRVAQSPKVLHPVIVYTYDILAQAKGAHAIISNCMIPSGLE